MDARLKLATEKKLFDETDDCEDSKCYVGFYRAIQVLVQSWQVLVICMCLDGADFRRKRQCLRY
jgi:hypothetical protein